jgi:hypothetical protein
VQVSGLQGRTAGASCCGRDRLRARDHGSGHRGRRRCRLGDTVRAAVAPFTSGNGPYRAPPIPRSGAAAHPLPPPPPAIEQAPEVHVHHHWHGVSAEDVAAIVRDGNAVNPGSGPRVTPAWPKRE